MPNSPEAINREHLQPSIENVDVKVESSEQDSFDAAEVKNIIETELAKKVQEIDEQSGLENSSLENITNSLSFKDRVRSIIESAAQTTKYYSC